MSRWRIVAPDRGRNEGKAWESREYIDRDEAIFEAAWLQARANLFGYGDLFTVVEVEA